MLKANENVINELTSMSSSSNQHCNGGYGALAVKGSSLRTGKASFKAKPHVSQRVLSAIVDSTFTTAQFLIDGFQKPIRFDRNAQGGGLMIYIRDRVPAKELSDVNIPNGIECGIVEINVHKKKWIMLGIYRPPSQKEKEFFDEFGKVLDTCAVKSDNFIVMVISIQRKIPILCLIL